MEIQTYSFWEMNLKISSAKYQPFYSDLNVLIDNMLYAAAYAPFSYTNHTVQNNTNAESPLKMTIWANTTLNQFACGKNSQFKSI